MAEKAAFKQKTVLEIMQQFFKDEKSKINTEGLALLKEVLRIFVSGSDQSLYCGTHYERLMERIGVRSEKDGSDEVTVEQVEKIFPELLLDL